MRFGPKPKPDAQRRPNYCTRDGCGAVFRRKLALGQPCKHCGSPTTQDPDVAGKPPHVRSHKPRPVAADYERHSLAIAGATQEWTDERVAAVLRSHRQQVRDGE